MGELGRIACRRVASVCPWERAGAGRKRTKTMQGGESMGLFAPVWKSENKKRALKELKRKQYKYSMDEKKEIAKNALLSEVRLEALSCFHIYLDNETIKHIACNDSNPLVRDKALERIIKEEFFAYPRLKYIIEHCQYDDVREKVKMVLDERQKRDAVNAEWRQANPSALTCNHDWASMTVDDPWNYHYRCTICRKQKTEPR